MNGWNIWGGIMDPAGATGEGPKGKWYNKLMDPGGAFQEGGMFGPAEQAELRSRDPNAVENQQALIGQLGQWAAGEGPSAAADQMRLGAGYGAAQAQGMAAGQTGVSPAQAMRMAQQSGMEQRARANEQAGILRSREQQEAMNMYATAVGQQNAQDLQEMQILAQLEAQNAAAREKSRGGMLSAAGGLIGGLLCDLRAKTEIADLDDAAVDEFVKAIQPSTYTYRDPEAAGAREGQQVGVIAQDIASTRIGRTFVKPDSDGTLRIDANGAVMALMAVVGSLGRRLKG